MRLRRACDAKVVPMSSTRRAMSIDSLQLARQDARDATTTLATTTTAMRDDDGRQNAQR